MFEKRSGKKIIRNSVDVSGTHGYQQIIFVKIFPDIILDFFKTSEIDRRVAQLMNFICQGFGADSEIVSLTRRINIGEQDLIGERKGLCKITHERLSPRVRVRHESNDDAVLLKLLCGVDGRRNFSRMMRVIVDNGDAVHFAAVFKAPLCTFVISKSPCCHFQVSAVDIAGRGRCTGIVYIVLAGDGECDLLLCGVGGAFLRLRVNVGHPRSSYMISLG